jgi:hypothetical protein
VLGQDGRELVQRERQATSSLPYTLLTPSAVAGSAQLDPAIADEILELSDALNAAHLAYRLLAEKPGRLSSLRADRGPIASRAR